MYFTVDHNTSSTTSSKVGKPLYHYNTCMCLCVTCSKGGGIRKPTRPRHTRVYMYVCCEHTYSSHLSLKFNHGHMGWFVDVRKIFTRLSIKRVSLSYVLVDKKLRLVKVTVGRRRRRTVITEGIETRLHLHPYTTGLSTFKLDVTCGKKR